MRRIAVAVMMVALAGGAARAQEVGVERAREAAWRFLTEGLRAPRPDLRRSELEGCDTLVERVDPRAGGPLRELVLDGFSLAIAPDGTVVEYEASDGPFRVRTLDAGGRPRTAADMAEEVEARTRFREEELRARAEAFVAERYPGWAERRFTLVESRRITRSPVEHVLVYVEEPRDGQLAVYPDLVRVVLNPETGEVTTYMATNVRASVDAPPPLAEADARRRAAEARPGEAVARVELTMIVKQGRARAVWLVGLESGDLVLVDAETGELHAADES